MRQYGFTLIEIVIVCAMVAVLASLAAPSMSNFIRASRLNSAANQFHADLLVARREAIRRNTWVLVCPKATATTCGTITSSTNWAVNGWLVCYDYDQNGQCDSSTPVNDTPNPIRSHAATDPSITITTNSGCTYTTAITAPIRFNADGSQGNQANPADPASPGYLSVRVMGTWTSAKQYCANVQSSGNTALTKPTLPTM